MKSADEHAANAERFGRLSQSRFVELTYERYGEGVSYARLSQAAEALAAEAEADESMQLGTAIDAVLAKATHSPTLGNRECRRAEPFRGTVAGEAQTPPTEQTSTDQEEPPGERDERKRVGITAGTGTH